MKANIPFPHSCVLGLLAGQLLDNNNNKDRTVLQRDYRPEDEHVVVVDAVVVVAVVVVVVVELNPRKLKLKKSVALR
jgi:hypothetical protein